MKRQRLISIFSLNLLLVFALSACVTDPASWSPDGRYLAYIGGNDQRLELLDTLTQEHRTLTDAGIIQCRFLANGQEIVYAVETNNKADFYTVNIQSGQSDVLVQQVSYYFDVSDDGRFFYFLKENESNGTDLWQRDLSTREDSRLFGKDGEEIQCVDADSTGNRFLLTVDENQIVFWEKGQNDYQLLKKKEEGGLFFPQWLDTKRYFYFEVEKDKENGNLMLASLDESNPTKLIENAFIWDLPSLSRDKKSVFVTQTNEQKNSKLVQVNLENGESKTIVSDLEGSNWAVPDPHGDRIALFSGDGDLSQVHIYDIKSEKNHRVWRDADERLMAISESLQQSGDNPLAISTARDLIEQYPNSHLVNLAWFRIMQMYLIPPNVDIDKAFDAWNRMPRNSDLANAVFWNEADRSASDPAEDWITQYCTSEAREKFEMNTDLTRDLLGFSVKWSDKRVFFKIDYNSNRDLSGMTFGDTVILLDFDSPNEGNRKIGDLCEWERGAERTIVLRHWYQNGRESQYNAAVLNSQGENVTQFVASGFAPPNLPHFNVIELQNDDKGSIVLSINKDTLDLQDHKIVNIQVCTLKGGIESFEGKERPLSPLIDGKPVCDVADAFGEDNTAERILNDAKAGNPAVIRGYATKIEVGK